MLARFASGSGQPSAGRLIRVVRLLLLLLPALLLLGASLPAPDGVKPLLWLGALFQFLGCLLALLSRQGLREPAGPGMIMLYVIALGWLVACSPPTGSDWFLYLSHSILLLFPLCFFGAQMLRDSGATALRQARSLAQRLARRTDWPPHLLDCRLLPEVKAFREALHIDASPALQLLSHPRAEVRVAALAALEFRQNWRPGQPHLVLYLAQTAHEPEVRASAVNALANIDDRVLVETLAEFLSDRSPLVRQITAEALLWDTEERWGWLRIAVHKALGDPTNQADGPLPVAGGRLGPEVLADLRAWTCEGGVLSERAALTLGAHYAQALAGGADPTLIERLRTELLELRTPPLLRLELAQLLHKHRELDDTVLRRLLDPSMPAPVRLIATEALLEQGSSSEAIAALYELGRLPNREIALATADVVQRRLGVDLGIPRGSLPALHTRQAAEIARRVLIWATQLDPALNEPAG
jgi:HEAT repeat protein